MPDKGTEITELLTDAAAALKVIKTVEGADMETRRAAFKAYNDVLLLIGQFAVDSYEGRTALLEGLIDKLSEFTQNIQVTHPIASSVDELTKISAKAVALFENEKKAAPTPTN